MTELWTFRVVEVGATPDVSGFDVEATDGHIGKLDDATYDLGSDCIVVDTGFWIFGTKRMIPAGAIITIDLDTQNVRVNLTKDQIKAAPDYDAALRDDEAYRQSLGDCYGGV